ncbi:hypothetical protein MSG28_007939 [Choristoneura fumiferana]|uniref:Uncharacterized protein n=1 Tax=Choristoneura fumiferana TaxID=7141 RepID=A0ACC0J9B5_CHOFU|nr:hypothetical protein MSG28_007939 [Choristoneura fumiferana]
MVTAPNDDWTEELCIKLIHEYRKRPILWDPKDQFFFKKAMKPEAWEGIAAAINMPADLFFIQEGKIEDNAKHQRFTSCARCARDDLLLHVVAGPPPHPPRAGVTEDDEDGTTAIKRSLLEHYNERKSVEPKKPKRTNSKIGKVLPNISPISSPHQVKVVPQLSTPTTAFIPEIQVPTVIPPLIPARNHEETLEEIKSFTNFIAYKMKKYSETTKNAVQQAICDIIFKADQNFYESINFEDNFSNYRSPQTDAGSEDCDLDEKTIDIGNGQTIKLQVHEID